MRSPNQKRTINKSLALNGLATLDDPRALLQQIAFLCRNEEAFRNLLLTVEPDKRRDAYEALRPRITSFTVKPLEDYIMEGRFHAERMNLPEWDNESKQIREPGHFATEELARKAIVKEVRRQESKRTLSLVCRRCTAAEDFYAATAEEAKAEAIAAGWKEDVIYGDAKPLCPSCSSIMRKGKQASIVERPLPRKTGRNN